MGGKHARAYAKMNGVEVAAISSRHLEKAKTLANEVGGRATTDNLTIINDPSIDAISNTLPTYLHAEYTIAALRAGKHVLLEKPFALTAAGCDGMIAAQKESGKVLLVAHVLRFWGDYISLVEFVQSGKIGKPLSAVATRLSQLPGWADWFLNPAWSGGAVLDLCVHDFDVLNWIFGAPKSVYARGRELKPGLWNNIHATVDYGDFEGFVEGSEFMPEGYPFTAALKVLCEGGVVEFMFRAGGVSVEMDGADFSRRLRIRQILRLARQARRRLREPGSVFRRLCHERPRAHRRHTGAGEGRRPMCRGSAPVARIRRSGRALA